MIYGQEYAEEKGSPLRMRGKEHFDILEMANSGITPAYAGKRRY